MMFQMVGEFQEQCRDDRAAEGVRLRQRSFAAIVMRQVNGEQGIRPTPDNHEPCIDEHGRRPRPHDDAQNRDGYCPCDFD